MLPSPSGLSNYSLSPPTTATKIELISHYVQHQSCWGGPVRVTSGEQMGLTPEPGARRRLLHRDIDVIPCFISQNKADVLLLHLSAPQQLLDHSRIKVYGDQRREGWGGGTLERTLLPHGQSRLWRSLPESEGVTPPIRVDIQSSCPGRFQSACNRPSHICTSSPAINHAARLAKPKLPFVLNSLARHACLWEQLQ